MNADNQTRRAAPQQLSALSHIAVVVGVVAVLGFVALQARDASHEAVQTASSAISNGPTYVQLQPVQAHRDQIDC